MDTDVSSVTMASWTREHALAAARQGWCIAEVSGLNTRAPLEVQKLDDAAAASEELGVSVPQLCSDDEAVGILRQGMRNQEPHALLAYQLLRQHSPQEFAFWKMPGWQ